MRRVPLFALAFTAALAVAAAAFAGPNDPRLHKRAADVKRAKTLLLKRADLPAGFVDGLPVAFQLMGRPHAEALLFRMGHLYQRETDWHRRLPPL